MIQIKNLVLAWHPHVKEKILTARKGGESGWVQWYRFFYFQGVMFFFFLAKINWAIEKPVFVFFGGRKKKQPLQMVEWVKWNLSNNKKQKSCRESAEKKNKPIMFFFLKLIERLKKKGGWLINCSWKKIENNIFFFNFFGEKTLLSNLGE